jgi:hypothetical protein
LRDVTGSYDPAFLICAVMAGVSVALMGLVDRTSENARATAAP